MPRPTPRRSHDDIRRAHHPSSSTNAADARRSIRPLLLLGALINLAWSLYQLPVSRVIESRLCRDHYAGHDDVSSAAQPRLLNRVDDGGIPEEMCKIDLVQRPLGRIQGVMDMLWVAGDFFMTIPLVSLADHLGYRPVLCLSLVARVFVLLWTFAVGYFDSILPVKAIIAAPAFSFLGGDCVVNSIVYAIASELAGDDHVLRATFFGWINATSSVFALQLGPALASATMTVLLWLPLWIGVGLLIVAIPVISALPLPPTPRCHQRDRLATNEENEAAAPLISSITTPTKTITLKDRAAARFRTLLSLVASPTRNFTLLLAVFFLASLASSDTKMLPLYASTRYRWTFAQVGYLLSAKAVFNFVFLTFVVPRLLRWRWRKVFGEDGPSRDRSPSPTPHRDQTTTPSTGGHRQHPRYARLTKDGLNASHAHTCLVLSVLGALAIALAPTPALLVPALLLYALGIALPMFTYSLLRAPGMGIPTESGSSSTSHRDEDGRDPNSSHHTHVFSVVMLIRTVGSLVGAAVMPSLWVMGLGWGGWALGLPFVASAAGYAVAAVLVKRMRV